MAGEQAPPPKLKVAGAPRGPQRAGVAAKEALLSAFDRMGGVAGLVKWGKKNPTEFYRIWARLLPREDNVNVTAVGVEELLRQLDEQDRANNDRLAAFDEAGSQLGLPRPESRSDDDNVVQFASGASQ